MSETKKYEGGCYCGKVRYEAAGPVQFSLACHCSICRRLHGSSFGSPVTFFEPGDFRFTAGEDSLREFQSPMKYSRCFCGECGTRVTIGFEKSEIDFPVIGVYTTGIDEVKQSGVLSGEFVPTHHTFYADRTYDVLDGKPKYADMPAETGGSGKMLDDLGNPIDA